MVILNFHPFKYDMGKGLNAVLFFRVSGCVHILSWIWSRICHFIEVRVFKGKFSGSQKWKNKTPEVPKKIGLDENISLPATGMC